MSNVLIILRLVALVVLCSYSVEEIEPGKLGKWIEELLQNHHIAIFIPKSGDGIAFNLESP